MNINWKVRLLNKQFWLGIVGALGTCAMAICGAFGWTFDVDQAVSMGTVFITAIFTVLGLMGVVTDPTTEGINDSAQAMTYIEPKKASTQNDNDDPPAM